MEHERQRAIHRKIFEDQMRALEHQQAQELLSVDNLLVNGASIQHLAVSAPTTPPRVSAMLNGDGSPLLGGPGMPYSAVDVDILSKAVGSAVDKRKSVTYASSVNRSPDMPTNSGAQAYGRGARSMPASRRTSASEHDEEIAEHLQGLSLAGEHGRASPFSGQRSVSRPVSGKFSMEEAAQYNSMAGMMLDEQLDKEMHSMLIIFSRLALILTWYLDAIQHLPTSDNDKYPNSHFSKVQLFGCQGACTKFYFKAFCFFCRPGLGSFVTGTFSQLLRVSRVRLA
jgi:hypothetical protein